MKRPFPHKENRSCKLGSVLVVAELVLLISAVALEVHFATKLHAPVHHTETLVYSVPALLIMSTPLFMVCIAVAWRICGFVYRAVRFAKCRIRRQREKA